MAAKGICGGLENMSTATSGGDAGAASRLNLTAREMEVCCLHLLEGRSQLLIAGWLGVSPQCVRQCVASAMTKQPALAALRQRLRGRRRRPRVVQLSQIDNPRDRERGGFNADEI